LTRTLVLALGSSLRGDDAVGPRVLEALGALPPLPDVDLVDGGLLGVETILAFEGYQRVFVVDAADFGKSAGTWVRVEGKSLLSGRAPLAGTLHGVGLADALELADALDLLPLELVLYGVQPQSLEHGAPLSSPVCEAVPQVARALRAELERG
jgi:hydrogenase maturation protease